ncbi:DUF3617 domain-containing protein [Novosphingobium sp.]|uniref:DUF3617 domain-containing protein n=1 Tax=Novosphingobium sp. TaxID=1874826 RepID=UPI0038BA26EE
MRHLVLPAVTVAALSLGLAACNDRKVEATNEKPSAVASKVAAAGGDSVRLNPGRWETRIRMVKMEIEGMPPEAKKAMGDMMGKERTVTSCLTREQAEKPDAKFFGQADEACTYDRFSMGGGTIDSKMTCKHEGGQQTMTMHGTYGGDSYATSMEMQGQGPMGKAMSMQMELSAKRTGDCTGKEDG